jgi:leucyl aminopeptidase (aminopeptidase T)
MRIALRLLPAGILLAGCGRAPAPADESAAAPTVTQVVDTGSSGASSRASGAAPSAQQLTELARRVVSTSIRVGPGDVVVIDGGKHTTGLMEALAIEAEKAGGLPNMWLESDRVARSLVTEVPDRYLEQKPGYLAEWYGHTTVWIGLGAYEDAKAIFADVPERKLAKLAATGQVVYDMLNASPIRGAFIDYPTTGRAAEAGLPFDRYAAMQWAALGADYSSIAAAGGALVAKLRMASRVRITTPGGTDLSFNLARRPVILDAGMISRDAASEKLIIGRFVTLPGGSVTLAPEESSVAGVIVVSRDRCKYKPLRDARYEFASGTLAKVSAKAGDDCVQENLRTYGAGMRRIGSFTVGLNPALRVIEDSAADYRPVAAAGLVTLSLGDNQLLGGSNKVSGGVSFSVPVTHATVEVDGEKVIEDGKLTRAMAASASR